MAEVPERTHRLHVYVDVIRGCYRWVLRSTSGDTIARSTVCYTEKAGCLSEAESFRLRYPGIVLRDLTARV